MVDIPIYVNYQMTKAECERWLAAEITIFQSGRISPGFFPGVTLEQMEEFAKFCQDNNETKKSTITDT